MKSVMLSAAVAGLVILAVTRSAAHDGPHGGPGEATFKVGKNGDVKIGEDVKAGPVLVKRGKYRFEHRIEGDRHTVWLTKLDIKAAGESTYELPMRLIPSREAGKRTAVHAAELTDHSLAMIAIEVAGENVAHVLDTQALATK